jgi:phosphoglycolate phosphatase
VGVVPPPQLTPPPAPLPPGADRPALPPRECTYVGDDLRDVQAARAAGMRAIAVDYGYHRGEHPGPADWNADATISHPCQLLEHL